MRFRTLDLVYPRIYHALLVAPKEPYLVKIDPELLAALREVQDRDGINVSEQIRRGIQLWLKSKGVTAKAAPRRAQTRRKA